MSNETTAWPIDLSMIAQSDDLHISPLRDDGITYGTPTWIWSVEVNNELYVRAYHGQKSSWYKAALKQKVGRILVAAKTMDVSFYPETGTVNKLIDEAYSRKYGGSPYLNSMISEQARLATIRIVPR